LPEAWPGFRPVGWLPGPDLQTIVPALHGARRPARHAESRIVEVGSGSAVRIEIDRPASRPSGTLLLLHGMGGSAESPYVLRTAALAVARGLVAARMNLRTCGGTEHLAATLYNAGQSDDVARVLEALDADGHAGPFLAVGFSLGGNVLLRFAGRAGPGCRLDALAAINPPIDLAACARSIERPRNWIYQAHYARKLRRQLRRIAILRNVPGIERLGQARTVRRFDELYTAPDAGYASSERYYAEASAAPWLAGVARPALVLSAANDPIVPVGIFAAHHGLAALRFEHPARGGHCGYWSRGPDRFWAAWAALGFFQATVTIPA